MRRLIVTQTVITTLAALLFFAGCTEDFEPFNEVNKLRIMAIKAEPPTLMPEETTTLQALVFEPDGELVEYRWDWCPIRLGSEAGFECAVTEEELIELATEIDPVAAALIPSFDLGSEPEASLEHFLSPEVLEVICEGSSDTSVPIPGLAEIPECDDYYPVSVRLTVNGEVDTAQAIKDVRFALNTSLVPNTNPSFEGVRARPVGQQGSSWELLEDGSLGEMSPSSTYDLEADVDESASEIFTPSPTEEEPNPEPENERLFLTWFVTAGETEFVRTGYTEGVLSFEDLKNNQYFTPGSEGEAELFLVLQDERGGVDWIESTIQIMEF